jgi:Mn-containing catalase
VDSHGNPWNGSYVFSSGNLKLDLLHNFFLECGARANKIRVYEMVDDPVAREMVGYLLVRGGVHIVAYARALSALSGVDVGKLLPIPDISNKRFPEAKKHEAKGLHQVMYRMSPDDYRSISEIWKGQHPEDGSELRVVDGPPDGAPIPLHPEEPQLASPIGPDGIDKGMLNELADRLFGKAATKS